MLSALVVLLGLYDVFYFYNAGRLLGWHSLLPLLGTRYFAFNPSP